MLLWGVVLSFLGLCAAQQALVFGQSSALSGPSADLGINMQNGTNVAFLSVNAAGGIFGRNLSLTSLNDYYEAPFAYNNTVTLLAQNVVGLLSYCGTPTTLKALSLANLSNVPMLAPFTGARALRTPANRYVINTRAGYDDEIFAFVQYCLNRSKTLFSIFYQNNSFGEAGLSALELALNNQNLKILSYGTFEANTVDVEEGLEKIKNVSITPEVFIMVGTASPLAKFVSMAKDIYPEAIFHSVSFLGSESFLYDLNEFNVSANLTKDLFVTQVFPIPQPLSRLQNASNLDSYLLLDYAKAMATHCPLCSLTFGSLEGYVGGMLVATVLKRMGELDSISQPFRRYLDDQNVSIFDLNNPASVAAVREYMLDTLYELEVVNVGGLRLGPYVQARNCAINQIDCIQPTENACSQGMHNVFLTQPDLVAGHYTELVNWRVSWGSCTVNLESVSPAQLPLVFGQTAQLSGPEAVLGLGAQAGIRAAFHVANEGIEGGVRARKLLLMSFDDYGSPPQALRNVKHLLDVQSIMGVLATTRSTTSNAIAGLLANSSTPFVGPLSGTRLLQERLDVINVRPGYDDEVAALVAYGLNQSWTRYSLVYEDNNFGKAGLDALSLVMKWHRSTIHSIASFDPTSAPNFPLLLNNLTTSAGLPHVVIIFANHSNTAEFIDFSEANSTWASSGIKYMCGSIVGLEVLKPLVPSSVLSSGRLFVTAVVPLHDPSMIITQNYLLSLKSFDNTSLPSFSSMEGYVTGRLVIWALQRAAETSSEGLEKEIFTAAQFSLDDLTVGPYVRQGCTMGLRKVWVLKIGSGSPAEVLQFKANSTYAEDCGAFAIYSDPECPRGFRKVYDNQFTLQARCDLCLNERGCLLPPHPTSEALRGVLLGFNIVGFVLAFLALVVVLRYRNTMTLRAASARFCALILLGAMIAHLATFVLYQPVTDQNCMAQVYLFNTAFSFFFGALFTKIYRITRIFGEQKRLRKIVAIKDSFLFIMVGVLWIAEMTFTVAWNLADPLKPVQDSSSDEYTAVLCRSSTDTWGLLNILANGIFLVYGIVLTVQSRNTPTAFNESRHLAATLYNAFLFGAIFIGLAFFESNDDQLYLCKALSVLLIIFIGNLFLFAPKFWVLFLEVVRKTSPNLETSVNNSSVKTGSTRGTGTGSENNTGVGEKDAIPL